jgi:hypothetical protein
MAGRFVQGVGWVELPNTTTVRYVQNQTTLVFTGSAAASYELTTATMPFDGQSLSYNAAGSYTLTAADFSFTGQSLSYNAAAVYTLSTADFVFTAQSLTYSSGSAYELSVATMPFVGQDLSYTANASYELTAASFTMTGMDLSYTAGGEVTTGGGHWLSPAQVKAEQKRQRKLEKARNERWERERLDAASIADQMRAALSPAQPVTNPVMEDDEDDDEILLLMAA